MTDRGTWILPKWCFWQLVKKRDWPPREATTTLSWQILTLKNQWCYFHFPITHPYDIKLCLVICHCSKPDEESQAWGATKTQADNSIWGPLQITYVSEPIQLPSSNPAYRTMALSLDAFVFPFFLLFFLHIFFIPGTISVCVLEGLSD